MPNRLFDLSKITAIVIRKGIPTDVSSGLSIDSDFFKVEPENKEETTTRKGTRGESYSANSNEGQGYNRIINLKYLPSSPHVPFFHNLRESKETFEFTFSNESSPAIKFVANDCLIMEEPPTTVNGKSGFADYEYKMRTTESTLTFL
ncbi:hypothetical protein [Leptospira alexanderi]|uniref:hypothetical protein n=1 Tax=Leptospira alexanderi TaxID=100053 RepID=UPI0009910123|nr:hypothetical protein [Leptospira alexanderi]